jgi:hypothetical protein
MMMKGEARIDREALRALKARAGIVFWSFDVVREHLVEAWKLLGRMPDRERAWLHVRATDGPWDQVMPDRIGLYEDAAPARLGLRSAEVDRMELVLSWLRFVRPADVKLIGLALKQLASDQAHVEWTDVKRAMAWAGTPDALRMRFGRALSAICHSLNSAENRRATCQEQQS